MRFFERKPCGNPPLNPPEPAIDETITCCVCDEQHDRLDLINFGSEGQPEYVCLETTCLVDYINNLQSRNAQLALKIAQQAREISHAI